MNQIEVFGGTGIILVHKSSLSTHTNESKQTDSLTPNGVREEEVSRVNGEKSVRWEEIGILDG